METYQSLSVTQLNQLIAKAFYTTSFRDLLVEGEVSGFKISGMFAYFTLKEANTMISCIAKSQLFTNYKIQDGDKILVKGFIELYRPLGKVQLNVVSLKQNGIGELLLKKEQLRLKLAEEGLFDKIHKKPIHEFNFNIGIITSENAAALHDALKVIKRKCPILKVTLYPTLVQGKDAANAISNQLKIADGKHDCLLLIRGGGSIEDLWCFNDENLVRTIFHLKTPIITGVGHEHDITLVDYAADLRASTPTSAAEACTFDLQTTFQQLQLFKNRLITLLINKQNDAHQRLQRYSTHPIFKDKQYFMRNFTNQIQVYEKRLIAHYKKTDIFKSKLITFEHILKQNIDKKLQYETERVLQQKQALLTQMHTYKEKHIQQFTKLCNLLDVLSPLKVLSRGYSIVSKQKEIIINVDQIQIDDEIQIQLKTGSAKATVKEVKYGK